MIEGAERAPGGKIFVSYSSADRDRVLPICEALSEQGYALWIDRSCLVPGDRISKEIDTALKESVAFLAFVGQHYFKDGSYASEEYYAATTLARSSPSWRIIPVKLESEAEVPPMMLDRLWVDAAETLATAKKIARALDHLGNIDGVSYGQTSPALSEWRPIDVNDLSQRDLRLLANGFIEKRIANLRLSGDRLLFEISLDLNRQVRFAAFRAIVNDEGTLLEINTELRQIKISQRYVESIRKTLIDGLLGRFQTGYEILLEEHQEKLERAYATLGSQLSGIANELHLRID